MSEPIVAVLGTRYPDLEIEERVLGPLGARLRSSSATEPEEVAEAAADAQVVLAGSAPRFDRAVLQRLACRGIVRYGIGTDRIDLEAARQRGIWVARVSDYGTEAVAVHAVSLAMAGWRRLVAAHTHVRDGGWGFADLRPLHLPSSSVAGIVGLGRIGRCAAGLLRGLGFRVLGHDPFVADEPDGIELVPELGDLLAASDVVSLHAPGDPAGAPLLGADELARCRPGSVLVNTARGTLIDQDALVAGLRDNRPGVAALDVFAQEPVDPRVFDPVADRVVLTPHMAWYSQESEHDLRVKAAQEAARLLRGERPVDVVVDPTQGTDR